MATTAGFEVFDPSGNVVVSSNFPAMNMSQQATVYCNLTDPYNSSGSIAFPQIRTDYPIAAIKPLTLGMYVKMGRLPVTPGDYYDYRYRGLQFFAKAYNFTPVSGALNAYLFESYAIDSGKKFGIKSWDENGKLLFDSESVAMRVVKITQPNEMRYDGAVDHGAGVDWAGYRTLFYSIPWPDDAEAYIELSPGTYSSGDGSEGSWGFQSSFSRLTLAYTYMLEYGLSGYTPGRVAFVRRT